jgi:hypothetical protein
MAFVETQDPVITSLSVSGATLSGGIYYTTFIGGSLLIQASSATPIVSYTYNQTGAATVTNISGGFNGSSIPLRTTIDGSYNISIQLRDLAGRRVSSSIVLVAILIVASPPVFTNTLLNSGNTAYSISPSVDIAFTGLPNTPYSVSSTLPSQIQPRGQFDAHTTTTGVIPSSGIVVLTITSVNGLNTITITTNPNTPYARSRVCFISTDITPPSVTPPSSSSLTFTGVLNTTYNIYVDGSSIPIRSGQLTSPSQTISLSSLNLLPGTHTIRITIVDSFGFTRTTTTEYIVPSRVLTYAPLPTTRTYYPTQTERTGREKEKIEKCCIHPNQVRCTCNKHKYT